MNELVSRPVRFETFLRAKKAELFNFVCHTDGTLEICFFPAVNTIAKDHLKKKISFWGITLEQGVRTKSGNR